jgi:sterol desaturase/sphingolipid hydroxylase (fatty acid hydroxylase superfamily)
MQGFDHSALLRVAAFAGVFAAVAAWEWIAPRRRRSIARAGRWPHNLALLLVDVAVLRVLMPGAAIVVAIQVEARGWGFLNLWSLPAWIAIPLSVAFLDLAIYLQHVLFHSVPALWRLHRVHHSDLDVDVTTGTRFHPIEIVVSTGIKCAAVAAIGAPPLAVLAFELLLNATSMFNHANARLPGRADRWLRWLLVTPDMHRVHHSVSYNESSSNFGFNTPWWDRLFGTYKGEPERGHEGMTLGVDAFRSAEDTRIDRLLAQPWRDTPGGYSINRRPEPASK